MIRPSPVVRSPQPGIRGILILALFLRLALPAAALAVRGDANVFLYNDSPNYLRLAASLADHGQYRGDHGPELYRPPGYPLFLAAALFTPHPLIVVIALQALLGVLTVYLVWLTAALLLPARGANAAAFLSAIDPLLVLWTTKVMSETLFTTLLMVFVYALVRCVQSQGTRWLIGASVALSAAAYVRAIAYLLPLWTSGLLLVWAWQRGQITRRLPQMLTFLLLSAALLGVWNLRNGRETGYFGFSTLADRAFLFAGGAAIEASRTGTTFYEARDRLLEDYTKRYQNHSDEDPQGYRDARKQGLSMIASAPMTYARFWIAGQLRTIFDPGAVEYLRLFGRYPEYGGLLGRIVDRGLLDSVRQLPATQPGLFWMTLLFGVWLLPYLVLPVVALFRAPRDTRPEIFIIFGIVVFLLMLSGGPYGSSRFRHPMAPLLAILAGSGLQAAGFRLRALTRPPRERSLRQP